MVGRIGKGAAPTMELTCVYEQDGDWIMGYIVEIPGVCTQGRTLDECRENLQDALRETIAARREMAEEDKSRRLACEHTRMAQVA